MNKKLETVLETFIKNEISATDSRIEAIRTFLNKLKAELVVYSAKIPADVQDKRYFSMVLTLFHNMLNTYDEEVKQLMHKREKMLEHLTQVRTVSAYLRPAEDHNNNLHIN